ncbi:MAG: hypothetical protein J5838_04035 [Desulfovibrio sp.]|nr:hypothetical protein [Desulfovibrio sp.]
MKRQLLSFAAALVLCFPLAAAAAQQQSFITGTVQGPDGAALDGATVYVCTGLVRAEREAREGGKARMVLYYSTAQPGGGKCEGTGRTGKDGGFKVRYPEGRQADLFAWKAGHEALIMRGVSSPSELGVLKLPGTNDSAAVERRNVETAQRAVQQKAENREKEGQRRQKAWEEREKTYPGGVHVPLPGLRDAELIARENSLPGRIKAIVLTPSGQPLEDGNENTVRVSFGENIQVEKHSPKKWFLANAIAHGSFYGGGRIDVLAPREKKWDVCIWAKGYEPLLIRNVTAPSDLGTVKLAGPNAELEELPHVKK